MSNYGRPGPPGQGDRPQGPGRGSSPPGGSRSYGPGSNPPPDDTVAKHWPHYLEGGYFDDQGNLRIQYVSRCLPGDEHLPDAQQHGVEPLVRDMANNRIPLTTGQLRRFFQHCRGLETRLKTKTADWPNVRAPLQLLDSAAADAFGKQPKPKIPDLFYDFIRRNMAAVKTEKDFRQGFLPHFEALVGFASIHVKKERN